MKGKVFIGWCTVNNKDSKNELAIEVKRQLEKMDYIGIVGGESKTSAGLHVGEAVLHELAQCNQAIFIMQKKESGLLSNNVMFELGYALAKFNSNKIHVFYIDISSDDETIPSDIKGIWANYFHSEDHPDMASDIVDEYVSNQKTIIPDDKMKVIDSYYKLKDEIDSYTKEPRDSEYEFAQKILMFSQAAYMFDGINDSIDRVKKFINDVKNPTEELEYASMFAIHYMQVINSIVKDGTVLYLKHEDFRNFKRRLRDMAEGVEKWPDDDFSQWFRVLLYDTINYIYVLYASTPDMDTEKKEKNLQSSIDFANRCLDLCDKLDSGDYAKENKYTVKLYRAYMYRNLHTIYSALNLDKDLAAEYLRLSFEARKDIKVHYEVNAINTRLFDAFEMEYFLALSESLPYIDDEDDLDEYKEDCEEYIKRIRSVHKEKNFFMDKIEYVIHSL